MSIIQDNFQDTQSYILAVLFPVNFLLPPPYAFLSYFLSFRDTGIFRSCISHLSLQKLLPVPETNEFDEYVLLSKLTEVRG